MKPISIEEIDQNLRICGVSNRENLTFYDVRILALILSILVTGTALTVILDLIFHFFA